MKTDKNKNTATEAEEKALYETLPIEVVAEKIKKEKNISEVYITNICGQDIIWRKLKRSEYKESMIQTYSENEELAYLEKQDFVAKKVILHPSNVDELLEEYAGISDIIALETMMKTGFGNPVTKKV